MQRTVLVVGRPALRAGPRALHARWNSFAADGDNAPPPESPRRRAPLVAELGGIVINRESAPQQQQQSYRARPNLSERLARGRPDQQQQAAPAQAPLLHVSAERAQPVRDQGGRPHYQARGQAGANPAERFPRRQAESGAPRGDRPFRGDRPPRQNEARTEQPGGGGEQRMRPPRRDDRPRPNGGQQQQQRGPSGQQYRGPGGQQQQQQQQPARKSRYAPGRQNTGESAFAKQQRARAAARETKHALVGTGAPSPDAPVDLLARLPARIALGPPGPAALFARPRMPALHRAAPGAARVRGAGDYSAYLPDAPVSVRTDKTPTMEHARFSIIRVRGASLRAKRRALDAVSKLVGPNPSAAVPRIHA